MKAKQWAVLLLAAVVLLAGCHKEETASVSEPEQPVQPVEAPDPNWPAEVGEVVLEDKPETVVSLSPALTEIVFELGGTLAGVSTFCDYPQDVAKLQRYGTADAPDLEALEKSPPDLLLSSVPLAKADAEALEALEVAVAVFPRAADLDGMEQTYVGLATLLGGAEDGPEMGKEVFGVLRKRYEALAARAGDGENGEISGIWLRAVPLVMATGDTFEGGLLEEALGLKNDAAAFAHWQYPPEKAVDLYPDVIFYDQSIDPAYFKGTQVYNTTDAYKQNRMYPFDSLPFERQSGRMFDELEHMAAALAGEQPETPGESGQGE